jgi:hypothetical protein
MTPARLRSVPGILERIDEETRSVEPSICARRDLAMLAGMCAAPGTRLAADLAQIRIGRS